VAASYDYEAIVIGAGLGGLGCAALLSDAGHRVLVLERNAFIGGRCSSYVRDGFTVDRGTHMITRSTGGPYAEIVRRLKLEATLEFIRLERRNPPLIEFRGRRIPFPFVQWTSPVQLALVPFRWRFGPRETAGAAIAMGRILTDNGCTARRLDDIDFERWLARYVPAGHARDLIGSLPAPLFGVPPWEFSAGTAITAVRDWFLDASSGYPKGGSGAVAEAFAAVLAESGAEVVASAAVERVSTYAGRVTGVRLADGTRLRSPVVISNLGIKDTMTSLVGARRLPAGSDENVRGWRYPSMSTVQVKVALGRRLVEAPCVMGSADPNIDLREFYGDILAARLPGSFMGIVNVPSNIDPGLAPPGGQLLLGMMLSPLEADDWEPWLELCMDGVEALVPGARDNALWVERVTPEDVARLSGRTSTASLGLVQSPGQVRCGRPPVETPLEGLYCVGDDTGREGTCSELALDSALRCSEIALRS
jgi:phytoene dehydrogenase-like protein